MCHRRLAAVGALVALTLTGAGSAFAAAPQQIYRDLVDNGRLDGKYTRAEIERAFNLPPNVRTDPKRPSARRPIGEPSATGGTQPVPAEKRSDRRMPFSAIDAALLVAGGGPLLLMGLGLRRRVGSPPSEATVTGG